MSRGADVVVVGGGMLGLSLALELARRGASVTVLERGRVGDRRGSGLGAASGALGAQTPPREEPEPVRDLALFSASLLPEWIESIEADSSLSCEHDTFGAVVVARNDPEEVTLDRTLDWQRTRGLPFEVLSAEEVREREPAVGEDVHAAFSFPREGAVHPGRLARALLLSARAAGVRVLEECPAHGLVVRDGRAVGVESLVGRLSADAVVNAAGASAVRFPEGPPLPVVPLRFEAALLDASADAERPSRLLASPDVCLVPRRDGTLVAASLLTVTGQDPHPAAGAVAALLSRSAGIAPAITAYPLLALWAGSAPGTLDGTPLLGETGLPGYWAATGLGAHGLGAAPGAALFLADLLSGETPPLPPDPFSPGRLAP